MKERVLKTLESIAENSLKNIDHEIPGLLSGSSGDLLFLIEYANYIETDIDPALNNAITNLVKKCDSMPYYSLNSLCNGKAGVDMLYHFMYEKDLLDKDDLLFLLNSNSMLSFSALEQLKSGNYDFLHGAIGIACSLMYNTTYWDDSFFNEFILELGKLLDRDGMFKSFNFELNQIDNNEVNLGLAHGVTSILKFCLLAYQKNICTIKTEQIANHIIDYLLSKIDFSPNKSYFPNVIGSLNHYSDNSRLAWCYGDLTIGFILYQASLTFKNKRINSIALEIMSYCATRRDSFETRVFDATICHGSSGITHVFNKMWRYTKDIKYKEATDFWINQTLEFGKVTSISGNIEYNAYNSSMDKYEPIRGVLMGPSGVGLVLLSYINDNFNWDKCIMLN